MNKPFASIKRGLEQAIRSRKSGSDPDTGSEIYSGKRIREFDKSEAELGKVLRRKKKSAS